MNIDNSSLLHNSSMYDHFKVTEETCEFVASIGAGLFYAVLFILVLISIILKYSCKAEASRVLFLVGAAILLLHVFTNDRYDNDDLKVKIGFEITVNVAIGILVLLMGSFFIFKKLPSLNCDETCNSPCNIEDHKDVNVIKLKQHLPMAFIGSVTLVILIMEIAFIGTTQTKSNHPFKRLIIAGKSIYLIEKMFQAGFYWLLCKQRCLDKGKVDQAKFYLKVLSFYNAVIWLDSMVNTESDLLLADVQSNGPPWVNIFGTLYKTCIIDYQMSFSLLFLEHSMQLSNEEGNQEPNEKSGSKTGYVKKLFNMGTLGRTVGVICCLLQLSCLSNYVTDLNSGYWVHAFPIIAEVFTCICCLVLSCKLRNISESTEITGKDKENDPEVKDDKSGRSPQGQGNNHVQDPSRIVCTTSKEEPKSKRAGEKQEKNNEQQQIHGLKIVLCCFGAVGLACWLYMGILVARWANIKHGSDQYLNWMSAKCFFRCFTALHLIYCFMKTNDDNMTSNKLAKKNMIHFLVGLLTVVMLSEFLGTAVDQYVGPIQEEFQKGVKKTSFKILLEVGPALYMAFCLHGSLHFFSILKNMRTSVKYKNRKETDKTSLLLGQQAEAPA